jgi:hypothetical protein
LANSQRKASLSSQYFSKSKSPLKTVSSTTQNSAETKFHQAQTGQWEKMLLLMTMGDKMASAKKPMT